MSFVFRLPLIAAPFVMAASMAAAAPQAGSSASSPIPVKGTERIGWDQAVPHAGWIVGFQFIAYVDDQPIALPDAKCSPVFCTQCGCAAPLPQMSNGSHRIEMVARDVFGGQSVRSAPLFVALGSVAPTSSASVAHSTAASSVEVLASTLDRPSAIAVAPDGRVFVAEESGTVRVWQDGRVESRPAATIEAARRRGVGLVDLTLDPGFFRNARVFVAYSAMNADGTFANRIVRYREVGGVFGEAAVIFEDHVREPALYTPRIRFGPDGKLYVLFPNGSSAEATVDASFAGKILRLNDDGTTPEDNRGATPVFRVSRTGLTAFAWQPGSQMMWMTEIGGSVAGVSGVLFVAERDRGDIGRIRFNSVERPGLAASEHWLDAVDGRITDLVAGPDGALYFCAVREGLRASDVLARLGPGVLSRN